MSKEDFLNNIDKLTNHTYTTNGAITNKSSLNSLLDFFGQAGVMRDCNESDVIKLFDLAFAEDKLRALKCVFYLGDILKGQGERKTFRILLRHIASKYPHALKSNISLIADFNRWDSVLELLNTELEQDAIMLIKNQLLKDISSDNPSLCAKWLKSLKASSKNSRIVAKKTAKLLNLTNAKDPSSNKSRIANELSYRRTLTELRSRLNIVEKLMSTNSWSDINFSHVPSKAMENYNKSFLKHDEERFIKFCEDLALNKATINSKALYPYEVVKKILNGKVRTPIDEKVAQAQWNALPNFIKNKDMKGISVVDVSRSMSGTPMEVAIATGLYISERCTGVYKDKFITFSESPKLVSVKGDTIVDKVKNMENADWGYNTNLEAVFELILKGAIANEAPQSDMPDYLIIITDMGFDDIQNRKESYDWVSGSYKRTQLFNKDTLIESLRAKFASHGYTLPALVLWNVRADGEQMPMTADEYGWISVSGYSPSIFTALLSEELLGAETIVTESIDPVKAMLAVLDSDRYKAITL